MPTMADLSLQNNAAATVTFTAITPSAGDSVAAQWRLENTDPPNCRATLTLVARPNKLKTVRTVDIRLDKPRRYTDVNTGLAVTDSKAFFTASLVVPQHIASSDIDDLVAYVKTAFSNATVIAALKAQVAPT